MKNDHSQSIWLINSRKPGVGLLLNITLFLAGVSASQQIVMWYSKDPVLTCEEVD